MFTPEDYKTLAEQLTDKILSFKPYQEAVVRTSISRAYYYIFLELRETVLANLTKEDKEKFLDDINHHILLQEVLFQIGKLIKNKEFIKASKALKQIRRIRNVSDYNISEGITIENYTAVKIDIETVEEVIQKIKTISQKILGKALEESIRKKI